MTLLWGLAPQSASNANSLIYHSAHQNYSRIFGFGWGTCVRICIQKRALRVCVFDGPALRKTHLSSFFPFLNHER